MRQDSPARPKETTMRAERGIALPTVIILLLLTASAAGWILYFKNQQTIAELAGVEADLAQAKGRRPKKRNSAPTNCNQNSMLQ